MKRIHAPKSWMLSKVGGIWATKPSQGPHKLRECIPLNLLLRTKLRLAMNAKEAKQWDIRKVGDDLGATPVTTTTIDHSSAIATPYFDKESKLLYTLGKGESSIHIFDYNTDKVIKCIDFQSKEPATAFAQLDRRFVDYNKNEIDRFIKFSKGFVYYVSFRIPRKVDIFDPELFPDVACGEPAQTFDEWAGGETKEPVKKKINEISNDFVSGENNFSKPTEGAAAGGASDEKVKELFNLSQTKFEKALREAVVTRTEKNAIMEFIRKLELNDYKKIKVVENYTHYTL